MRGKPDPHAERIERLEEVLMDIALIADGHKASRLYVNDENVALIVIRNMASGAIGLEERLREEGTIIAPMGTIIEVPSTESR